MKFPITLINLLFIGLLSFATDIPSVAILKTPEWKTTVGWDVSKKDFSKCGEISYLLIDWQNNEMIHESSYRYVIRLNNEDGVQNNSQLSVSFDPSYQKLAFTKILIHRGDQTINHLKRSEIELLRNEQNADRLLYDGTYSALVILKDIRIGDILEYEYSIKGENPLFENLIYNQVSQSYSEEILHLYRKILIPASSDISFKTINNGVLPTESVSGKTKSLTWDLSNRPAIFSDLNVPSWYIAYPICEISSMKTWTDVKKWGKNLYPHNVDSPSIESFIRDRKIEPSEQGILKTIRFVQDEIRYLGIESGIHSHKPHHPEEVFKNRFGDCKDKAYLLVTILYQLGIEAWPAYLSSTDKGHVDEHIPSPFAFDHVIVKFRWNNRDYWVDPTINQQRGNLSLFCNPDYKKALVLDDLNNEFDSIPVSQYDKVVIHENLWFSDSASAVKYSVESDYYGNLANLKRNYHTSTPTVEIRENYINYCSNYYSNLKWANDSALTFTDYPEINQFNVKESYFIPDFWDHSTTDSIELFATVYPYNLFEFLSYSKDQSRKMPLSIYYPIEADITIELHFPTNKRIGFKNENDSIKNKAYSFYRKTSVDQKSHIYKIKYSYTSHTDHVTIDDTKAYFKDYDRLSEFCEEYIQWGVNTSGNKNIAWLILFISLFFAGLLIIPLKWVYKQDFGIIATNRYPLNFGGWLIIPMIGLIISPVTLTYQIIKTGYFNAGFWENFLDVNPTHPILMGAYFYFELLFNVAVVVFSIFLIVLMFQRRASFPKLFVGFMIFIFTGVLLDVAFSIISIGVIDDTFNELIKRAFYFAIWVPYFLISERVKNTFVNRYNNSKLIDDTDVDQ
jgi:hypothetical protein